MNPAVFVAACMLLLVFGMGVLVLRQDARRRRIERQLAVAVQGSPGLPVERRPGIRLQDRNTHWLVGTFRWLIHYDPEAALTIAPWQVALLAVIAGVGAMVVGRMALPLWVVPGPGLLAGLVVARGLFGWQRDRYGDRLVRQVPDTIELVVAAVRAGLPVQEAFRGVAREIPNPTGEQFERVVSELAVGMSPEEALLGLYHRTKVSEYAIFSVTLAVQTKAGGRLAETLQILADTVRQRVALAARAKALAGEAKLSARVLAFLPFAAGTVMWLENPNAMAPLFQDQRGRTLFALGLGSLVLGVLTMRRMIKKGTTV